MKTILLLISLVVVTIPAIRPITQDLKKFNKAKVYIIKDRTSPYETVIIRGNL